MPTVTWEQIGGQKGAIEAIRKAIEYPLLHAETFQRYQVHATEGFSPLWSSRMREDFDRPSRRGQSCQAGREIGQWHQPDAKGTPPVTRGAFLHVKGPEILNMWLGESERMVRDLFAKARARRKEGALPFIFIDEAESILGDTAGHALIQYLQHAGADVLF